jgi:hypothetical protein
VTEVFVSVFAGVLGLNAAIDGRLEVGVALAGALGGASGWALVSRWRRSRTGDGLQ